MSCMWLCGTVEVCVVFLDTLTPVFELYVRLRERRQWDSNFPEFGAPARDSRGARHGPTAVRLQLSFILLLDTCVRYPLRDFGPFAGGRSGYGALMGISTP
ncbi:hypothetical protein Taro_030321, partial [Colocasia esculenta]|nr:hypothetical protein [Colocasia esculenta]